MRGLKLGWLGRIGSTRRSGSARPPLVASRDLPPLELDAGFALPRSPRPMPEEALRFAQGAARPALKAVDHETGSAASGNAAASIATGADLRAMLERFERGARRRQALDQALEARSRLVERLSAGKAAERNGPMLRLVGADEPPPRTSAAQADCAEEARLDKAMDEALASALITLRQLSALARN